MHRFRKRSDARRPQGFASTEISVSVRTDTQDVLPSLPPASDFRTSLILPDLTRRFSVLRNSSGEPIGLDELKSKFAEQRARGSQNQVTEEEEDMILEALGRFHGRSRSRGKQRARESEDGRGSAAEGEDDDADPVHQAVRSSDSTTAPSLRGASSMASISSAKNSLSSRRMSNNLFGSGKFRDQAYFLRTANPRRGGRGTGSIAQSESNASMSTVESARGEHNTSLYSDNLSLRPTTPEDSAYTFGSAPSSPENASTLLKDRSSLSILGEQSDYSSTLSRRLSKALPPDGLKRASLALDQAIRELEEEGDDEIVMERSPIAHVPPSTINGSLSALNTAVSRRPRRDPMLALNCNAPPKVESDSSPAVSPSEVETGTALSSDDPVAADNARGNSPHPGSRTTSPTPRLPGYIPGMPRPMTPRDTSFDTEDLTPSATPRATSPHLPGLNTQVSPLISQTFTSSMYRSNSSASTYSTNRPISPATATTPPLFFNRPMNGRYTPEERQRNGNRQSSPTSDTAESPILGRRRPISPLSGPAYQPMTSPPSRPTTPSNVTWNVPSSQNGTPQKPLARNGSVAGHSRNGSTASVNDQTEQLERSKSTTRSLRSPALPDSPWVDVGLEYRPPSAMSGIDIGSPVQGPHSIARSPTPNGARSPASPAYTDVGGVDDGRTMSRRSSKHHSSYTFSLGQPNALLFSPLANSSHSSLESAGSSYHSWDEDHKKDRLFGVLSGLDPDNIPWHDISPDKSAPSTAGTSPYDATETEDAVRREVGLSKGDFIVMQDKLVGAALTKAVTPENRRAGSIRRRRPSTSQSNYSYNGESRAVNSTPQPQPQSQSQPQPQPQAVASSPRAATSEQVARANALLNAVVDSIESPRVRPPESLPAEEPTLVVPQVADIEQSSPMRRNRALAEALFGAEDMEVSAPAPQISIMPEMSDDDESPTRPVLAPIKPLSPKRSDSLHRLTSQNPPVTPPARTMPTSPTLPLSPTSIPLPMTPTGIPMSPGGGLLSPLSPSSNMDPISLALEVQRRAEAATAALRKSPSIPKMGEGNGGTLPRKRISPDKISAPTLVSASTSVDAIPLRSPTATPTPTPAQQQQASKIGSRFKKLRGTIRAKHPTPSGEEVTPYPLDLRSAGSDATGSSSPSLALRTDPITIHSAGVEPSRLKPPTPLASPPASAAPGLKGFMARFRKQRNASEAHAPPQSHPSAHHQSYAPMSATSARPGTASVPLVEHTYPQMPRSAPALQTVFRSTSPVGPQAPSQSPTPRPPQDYLGQHSRVASPPGSDEDAIKQLFHAAENLGLDQAALNELLARSPSTSSRSTAWTQLTRATSPNNSRKSHVPVIRGRVTPESVRSPMSDGRPSVDGFSPRPSMDTKPSGRRSQDAPHALRPRPQQQHHTSQQDAVPNAVVRRTIIFPSDARLSSLDLQAIMRKQTNSRRRASVSSKSSVHDRVPTPPPPHRATGRRFSTDVSPPVPQLPPALSAQNDAYLGVPGAVDRNGLAYDSVYEMYSGDNRGMVVAESPGAAGSHSQEGNPESGPALEVIELANGETIWSIVNGLRDDDGESFYGDRASFYSEYSVKDNDNVKLFFKEHERKNSRGSVNSFLSRKKPAPPQPPQQQPQSSKSAARPETKVFFSSSAQIGRLIENLSRGMDAGSFNIMPGQGQGAPPPRHAQPGHSTSSSLGSEADMPWSVEERLERMLGSMGAS
uniref:SGE1 protein n=1 Tax=Ganoderma boninense TaxID=34458 RepID=A0A5K1K3V1_9APHY|nr:SGE1 protein [Ganoderma boninense]